MYAVSVYTSDYYFPTSLLSAQRFLYFVQMSDVTKHYWMMSVFNKRREFVRFILVGVLATATHYGIYFFLCVRLAQPASLKSGSESLNSLLPWKNCFQSSFLPRALV